jgi:predicted metallo-beta-lactamase superfamily hydrolase
VASDSMGTRSMASFIEAGNLKIFIDPGVALGPSRYGLPPHPLELNKLNEHWNEIVKYAEKAEVIIITHYHYDHHSPWENLDIYKNKILLIKHPKNKINMSQKIRAAFFLKAIKNLPKTIDYCDSKEYFFGDVKIKFSNPVYHGANEKLGYVTEVLIKDYEDSFLFTSDIEGASLNNQLNFIIENKPKIIYLDGPMSYMLGYRFSFKSFEDSIKNIEKTILECPLKTLIIDHHLLRDVEWKEKLSKAFKAAEMKGVKIETAAEFEKKPLTMLEARRKELYEEYPLKA